MYPGPTPWTVRSSFVSPVPIPESAPGDTPRTCVSFNSGWLPLVIGALLQLAQPAAWDTADDAARQAVLLDVQDLLARFGVAGGCMLLRWNTDTCAIEQSTDDGATWAAIDGWDLEGVQGCVLAGLSIRIDGGGNLQWSTDGGTTWTTVDGWPPPTPPNPSSAPTDQEACNISLHLAQNIIQGALVSAINSFDTSISEAAAAAAIIALIPGFGPEIALTIEAATGIAYLIYNTGSIGDYRTASTSATLLSSLVCAIYGAIRTDGAVTAGNFAAVQTAIHAIAYSPTDVQDAIDAFVTSLDANGMMAAQQLGGLVAGDCSACSNAPVNATSCGVFNGTNDYASTNVTASVYDAAGPAAGPMSIGAWVKIDGGTIPNIFNNMGTSNVVGEIVFRSRRDLGTTGNHPIEGVWRTGSSTGVFLWRSSTFVADSTWSHVAFTTDGAGAGQMYINGSAVSQTFTSTNYGAGAAANPRIGSEETGASGDFFQGKMKDMQIANVRWTTAQVLAIYNGGKDGQVAGPNLVARWLFNQISGASVTSQVGAHSATWHGSPPHWGFD